MIGSVRTFELPDQAGLKLFASYRTGFLKRVVLTTFLIGSFTKFGYAQIPLRSQQNIRPPELNVQFHRAETAWKSGNSVLEAKARIDRVIRALPDDLEARKLRAGILLTMGQAERALADARRAVRIGPDDGEAHLLLCEAAARTDQTNMATEALGRSAELLLNRPDLHIRLSRCAVDLFRMDEAEAYARIALAADDMNAAAYLQLARVFVKAGQAQKAVTVLEKGLRLRVLRPTQLRRDTDLVTVSRDRVLASYMNRP